MPLHYDTSFDIRHYECDAFAHVNHGVYLQWMQEAALRALAMAGHDVSRAHSGERFFRMRFNDITYYKPLVYGDSVRVHTEVVEACASHIRNIYDITDARTGSLAASGICEWVLMDTQTLTPRPIPDFLIEILGDRGPHQPPAIEPLPPDPPLPEFVYTLEHAVEWRDLDFSKLVNGAAVMDQLENISWRAGAAMGWPMSRMMAMQQGFVARRYRIQYLQAAGLGDILRVATWASQPRRATGTRHYTIHNDQDGQLLVRAQVLWVWVDFRTGLPRRIPQTLLDDFAPNISQMPEPVRPR